MKRRTLLAATAAAAGPALLSGQQERFRIAIAGLVHGHASGFLQALGRREDVELVGVSEGDESVRARYASRFNLSPSILFGDAVRMIDQAKPQAVAAFTNTFDHPAVVAACAASRTPVMMEKPLAVSVEHARAIEEAARKSRIPVVVNYETTWYRSHAWQWHYFKVEKPAGAIRKMVAMDGHQGPKEIGVGPEFLAWLTDPVKNGAGALFDFGCYGANLMTWMMDNQKPLGVTARTLTAKPHIYGRVDDEATVVLDYPGAQGIIQASWNWPFSRKDFEVYGVSGYAHANGGGTVKLRRPGANQEEVVTPQELSEDERDPVSYLRAVATGRRKPSGLSSLENNLIATEILVAARESAKSGKTVKL